MPKTSSTVAEIVTFKLVEGTQPEAFVTAASALAPLLQDSGEVINRCLSCDDQGLWTDHIVWRSMSAAKIAADQILSNPAAAPMMHLIDPQSVVMRHAPIHYTME